MLGKMLQLPGATGGDVTKRDGYDPAETSALTLAEFEHWLIRDICRYHLSPHEGLGKIAPIQRWQDGLAGHGGLVPPGLDLDQLSRRFLPWHRRTVTARGIQIDHRHYWHPDLASRIGLQITAHFDDRTIQMVYPEIDGTLVTAQVLGTFPDVTKIEWDADAAAWRKRGHDHHRDNGQAAIALLVQANRAEVTQARIRTRDQRRTRKRLEQEGASHGAAVRSAEKPVEMTWVPVAQF